MSVAQIKHLIWNYFGVHCLNVFSVFFFLLFCTIFVSNAFFSRMFCNCTCATS